MSENVLARLFDRRRALHAAGLTMREGTAARAPACFCSGALRACASGPAPPGDGTATSDRDTAARLRRAAALHCPRTRVAMRRGPK